MNENRKVTQERQYTQMRKRGRALGIMKELAEQHRAWRNRANRKKQSYKLHPHVPRGVG
jgi:hypothetical protein